MESRGVTRTLAGELVMDDPVAMMMIVSGALILLFVGFVCAHAFIKEGK